MNEKLLEKNGFTITLNKAQKRTYAKGKMSITIDGPCIIVAHGCDILHDKIGISDNGVFAAIALSKLYSSTVDTLIDYFGYKRVLSMYEGDLCHIIDNNEELNNDLRRIYEDLSNQ